MRDMLVLLGRYRGRFHRVRHGAILPHSQCRVRSRYRGPPIRGIRPSSPPDRRSHHPSRPHPVPSGPHTHLHNNSLSPLPLHPHPRGRGEKPSPSSHGDPLSRRLIRRAVAAGVTGPHPHFRRSPGYQDGRTIDRPLMRPGATAAPTRPAPDMGPLKGFPEQC
jgi:hypothetical protein